ncbi:uncharacterized protein AAGF69_015579 [Amazona ochrocephala]
MTPQLYPVANCGAQSASDVYSDLRGGEEVALAAAVTDCSLEDRANPKLVRTNSKKVKVTTIVEYEDAKHISAKKTPKKVPEAGGDGSGRGLVPGCPAALHHPGPHPRLRLCEAVGSRGGAAREPPAAETAREHGPGDQDPSPVAIEQREEAAEELSPAAEPSPAAAKPREEAAEKQGPAAEPSPAAKPSPAAEPSPAAKPSPATTENIPRQLPAEPRDPEPQEDAGDHAALPSKAEEEDLDSKSSWW